MMSTMPPIFSIDFSSPYRPSKSSPLSSSPLRASQSLSPPLSPRDINAAPPGCATTQSSPIPAPRFKYASRDARKNPLKQSRETAQEGRRKLFLKNVRQRRDDQQWDRRGGDQEVRWRERCFLLEPSTLCGVRC